MAYLRVYDDETILVVNNLADETQACELDLAAFAGVEPVDLFTGQALTMVTDAPYHLELPRYGYCWLQLHPPAATLTAIRGRRLYRPALIGAPDSTTLLREDRGR